MDEHLFRGITNPARRRRLLLQHASHVAGEMAEAAQELVRAAQEAGWDLDPVVVNRAGQLQKLIKAASEIDDAPVKPNTDSASADRMPGPRR